MRAEYPYQIDRGASKYRDDLLLELRAIEKRYGR